MTIAPDDLKTVQQYVHDKTGQDWNSLGIIHSQPLGGGYHEGQDLLTQADREPGPSGTYSDYSYADARAVAIAPYGRDLANATTLAGVPNAASAFDMGLAFPNSLGFNAWMRDRMLEFDPRTRDIREMIYTLNGSTVRRIDRTGRQADWGDSSHLSHTHFSFFRDSHGRRANMDNFLGLLKQWFEGITPPPANQEDDEMGASTPPIEIPVTGRGSFSIPPVRSGAADPRPCWINFGNSLEGTSQYGLRLAGFTPAGPYSINVGTQIGSDPYNRKLLTQSRYSQGLADGTYMVEISRISPDGVATPYAGHLTFCFERGAVGA